MTDRKRENTVNFAPGPAALPDEVSCCQQYERALLRTCMHRCTRFRASTSDSVYVHVYTHTHFFPNVVGGSRGARERVELQGLGGRSDG